ncbi:MAG: hypothetical protein ACI9HK_005174, partial [Pirellulaceae bacterium]
MSKSKRSKKRNNKGQPQGGQSQGGQSQGGQSQGGQSPGGQSQGGQSQGGQFGSPDKAPLGLSGFREGELHQKLRNACLATFVALVVITHFQSTESWSKLGSGAMTIMMWSLLLAAWGLTGLLKQQRIRGGFETIILAAFLGWIAVSGYITGPSGNLRETTNTVWIWVTLGTVYFLSRQLFVTGKEQRALCGVMIALALVLSCHGYYQFFYSMPKGRAEYYKNPDEMLKENQIDAPAGTVMRKLLESRLESDEPFATFGLANSLAGMLTPWLLLTTGLVIVSGGKDDNARQLNGRTSQQKSTPLETSRGVLVVILIAIGGCVVLTKSRSAWLAICCGLAVIAFVSGRRSGERWNLRYLLIGAGVVAVILSLGFAVGSLDKEVFTQAGKSLGYRLEYWRSTTALIADHPLWGCGVGNYQDYYTQYKLPQASETIADPHNFAFEIAATAGVPALLIFVGFLVLVVRTAIGRSQPEADTGPRQEVIAREDLQEHSVLAIFTGAFAGLIVAYPCGFISGLMPPWELVFIGLPLGTATILLLTPWIQNGQLPKHFLLISVGAILINLLAAGGIAFPAVALSFWILVAILFNCSDTVAKPAAEQKKGKLIALSVASCCLIMAATCNFTAYSPVIRSIAKSGDGRIAELDGDLSQALISHRTATKIDPLWPEAKQQYANLLLKHWQLTKTPESLALFQQQAQEFG